MNSVYDINSADIKSLAVANKFVIVTNKLAKQWGKDLKPFSIYGREQQRNKGVIDLKEYSALLNPNLLLVDEIVGEWSTFLSSMGINVDLSLSSSKKLLLFDYLMHVSACYVELPKYITKDGNATPTYDKFFVTRNPKIIAMWLGITEDEAITKYLHKIQPSQLGYDAEEVKYVKLNVSKTKGNTVTVPRKFSGVQKMTCIPLYMLAAFGNELNTHLQSNIIQFDYLKDNGTVRELPSTLSRDILESYYDDKNYVDSALYTSDVISGMCGMTLSANANRGYIRVPELGSSIYDGTGVRAVNLSRLLEIKVIDKVDRTFIKVNLDCVVEEFSKYLSSLSRKNPNGLMRIYDDLVAIDNPSDDRISNKSEAFYYDEITKYVTTNNMLFSTTFRRRLHIFMIEHFDLFDGYTGAKRDTTFTPINTGLGVDTGLDDLDLSVFGLD